MSNKSGFSVISWIVVVVIVAGLAGGGIWYWLAANNKEPEYKTATVTRGDIIQTVTATGQINPETNVTVGSQVSGIIDKLYVDFNSPVTNGQLIVRLEPSIYKAALSQTKGDLASAKAGLALSQVEAKRAEELHKASLISQSDFDTATANLRQAEAMVEIKQAAVDKSQVDLDHTSIYAPVDGVVISRAVDVGQTVAASLSAPTLFIIANDLAKMQIDALVSEADIGGVKTNQRVNFTVDAFPSRIFTGVVTQIRYAAMTNQNVISYDTVIGVNNSSLELRPGMTANVSVITARQTNALKIPNGALRFRPPETDAKKEPDTNALAGSPPAGGGGNGQRRGGGGGPDGRGGGGRGRGERSSTHVVYVPDTGADGKKMAPKPVTIHTGIGDGIFTEVVSGLDEGDAIITGQSVTVAAPGAPGQPAANPFGGGGRRF